MDYQAILDRILLAVDQDAYLTPVSHIDPEQRAAMGLIQQALRGPGFDPDAARALANQLHADGSIDRVMLLSALHVIAAHPSVADYAEAARLAGEQELAALELGGPNLNANLASADRHRGVVAFLRGHAVIALDYFSRALERERTAENLGNVLCALLKLGEEDDAVALLDQIRGAYPSRVVAELQSRIEADPDLALLRDEEIES